MADIEEDIRWDLEFDKIRDKDDLGLITADDWFLSDDILMSRVHELFDLRNPLCDELNELGDQLGFDLMELSEDIRLGDVKKGLKRKLCDKDEKVEERGGECLKRKRVCGDGGDLNKSNDKLEKAKRKLREGYDSYSRNRKTSQVISLNEVGSKRKIKTVDTTKTAMKGKVCKDGARDVMVIDEKKRLNDVFKFSYAERVEMAKAKLQQGYDRCASERKKTCVINLKDIPKPTCASERKKTCVISVKDIPKLACSKRVGRFKRQHCLPLSNTIRGY